MSTVAGAVVEFALSDDAPVVANIVHPRPVPYSTIMKYIREAIGKKTGKQLKPVRWDEWLKAVESSSADLVRTLPLFCRSPAELDIACSQASKLLPPYGRRLCLCLCGG